MRRIPAREGQQVEHVDLETAQLIRSRLVALRSELAARTSFLSGDSVGPTIQNLVGSVQLRPDLVLDVSPKTVPDGNWAASVIDLIVDENAHFAGLTTNAEMSPHRVLADTFAHLYLEQIDDALRRDGPLQVMQRIQLSRQRLAGRLDVTRWLAQRTIKPHEFPQEVTVLTVDNDYTAALAWVAEALASRCIDPMLAGRLRAAVPRLRPGLPEHVHVSPDVASREVPPQWRAYEPAWVTACAVLRRISPIHRSGFVSGFNLAIEPWPLLERLLHRSLAACVRLGRADGSDLSWAPQSRSPFLKPVKEPGRQVTMFDSVHTPRGVEPDGLLRDGDKLVATFESKYTIPSYPSTRSHFFQAVATAAAMGSPLSVLVYPDQSDPVVWRTHGFDGTPRTVVALGLGMYNYARGAGDRERGRTLLDLVRSESPFLSRRTASPVRLLRRPIRPVGEHPLRDPDRLAQISVTGSDTGASKLVPGETAADTGALAGEEAKPDFRFVDIAGSIGGLDELVSDQDFTAAQLQGFTDIVLSELAESAARAFHAADETNADSVLENRDIKEAILSAIADTETTHGRVVDYFFSDDPNVELLIAALGADLRARLQVASSAAPQAGEPTD